MHSHLLFVFPASDCMVKGISVATSVHFLRFCLLSSEWILAYTRRDTLINAKGHYVVT